MIRRKDGVSRTATISDAMNSPSRMPASNPSLARSTSSSLAAISTDTSGYAAQKEASSGRSTTGTTARGTANRSRPDGFAPRSLAALLAAIISWNAGCARSRKRLPASVKPTLRVVRVNSATPTRPSSARTAWLTAEGVTPRSAAAARKLLRSATRRNTSTPSSAPRWTVYLCFTVHAD